MLEQPEWRLHHRTECCIQCNSSRFSGDVKRHRLSRTGDRQLNSALHVMAITQIRHPTAGQAYYQRKRAEGKGHKEALRCLKRRLADVVYRTMIRDRDTSLIAPA
ncbi:transposase [Streptomyces sp. NPDC046977]|uniref:transposase n=1 Tax=Streptomyces sp. NPDC046977 TaxID=3154703 RepID=UPI003410AF0F